MEQIKLGAKEKEWYQYNEYPKNVRQIGIPISGLKIYLEDYVITYLKQCFVRASGEKIVILLGKRGEENAVEGIFIYGAIALEEEGVLEKEGISSDSWDVIHETIHQKFPGAQVMGWACGAPVVNSQVDGQVRKLHKKEFKTENQMFFLWDLCEKEEKVFLWQKKILRELSGYYVYFEKNPQMQEFMLGGKNAERIEAAYEDSVTQSMRHVMAEKEEHRKNIQLLTYCGVLAAGIAVIFGAHMVFDSSAKLKKMEKTVDTLSEYVEQQRDDVEVMSKRAGSVIKQIPFESQSASPDLPEDTAKKGDGKAFATGKPEETATFPPIISDTEKPETTASPPKNTLDTENTALAASHQKSTRAAGKSTKTSSKKSASGNVKSAKVKNKMQSYVVQKGDTLSQIIWRQYHDLSYEKKVKKANGIKNADEIYEGQRILLPPAH